MESYYRLQYEILRLIDDGKISEAQQYLWKKVHQQDTDALAIIGFLHFSLLFHNPLPVLLLFVVSFLAEVPNLLQKIL